MKGNFKSIVLLDKPPGPTSLECTERARKLLGAGKAGHAGTLDPNASGVLVIALGEATKAMPVLMGLEKEYEGVMHMHRDFDEKELKKAADSFAGKITQTPPVKSAVSRKPRERNVYSFEITQILGRNVHFRVVCEAGTYIRKLCSDLGEKTGLGAHMLSLRRTRAGPFLLRECQSFKELKKKPRLVTLEKALERVGLKRVFLKQESVSRILNGSPVKPSDLQKAEGDIKEGDLVGIFLGKSIIGLGTAKTGSEKMHTAKGSIARTDRVFRI